MIKPKSMVIDFEKAINFACLNNWLEVTLYDVDFT